jgi:hypothetical protein
VKCRLHSCFDLQRAPVCLVVVMSISGGRECVSLVVDDPGRA